MGREGEEDKVGEKYPRKSYSTLVIKGNREIFDEIEKT